MIKIRFCTGNDVTSDAIREWQKDGWASHVEAVLLNGSLLGAHLDGGVQIRIAGYDAPTLQRELIVSLDVPQDVEDKFYLFCRMQIGKAYDVTAIGGILLGREWREDDSWFCSELMAAALEYCGYLPKLSSEINHISPRDLLLVLSGRIVISDV